MLVSLVARRLSVSPVDEAPCCAAIALLVVACDAIARSHRSAMPPRRSSSASRIRGFVAADSRRRVCLTWNEDTDRERDKNGIVEIAPEIFFLRPRSDNSHYRRSPFFHFEFLLNYVHRFKGLRPELDRFIELEAVGFPFDLDYSEIRCSRYD